MKPPGEPRPKSDTTHVTGLKGRGDLSTLEVVTPFSSAEIYLQGATVTHFQRQGEEPLLFLSQCGRFEPGFPIRGGIPICFPWFGMPEGRATRHGYARGKPWDVEAIDHKEHGGVTVQLRLPRSSEAAEFPLFSAECVITVDQNLALEFRVINQSPDQAFRFDECLHTYFRVGDVRAVSVSGLNGLTYLDNTAGLAARKDAEPTITFAGEVDRVYRGAPSRLEIRDESLRRRILIEATNARSTVVWNPWIEKARSLTDFCDDEYQRMVCVESGNVYQDKVDLKPGEASSFKVCYSTEAL